MSGDLNIVRNQTTQRSVAQGPEYSELVSFSWQKNFDIIIDGCEEFARRWAKKEAFEVDTLSEWVKSIADLLKRIIARIKRSFNTRHEFTFCGHVVAGELSRLDENFDIVPADKAVNNYHLSARCITSATW